MGKTRLATNKAQFNQAKLQFKKQTLHSTSRSSQSSNKCRENPWSLSQTSLFAKQSSQSPFRALKNLATVVSSIFEGESVSKPTTPRKSCPTISLKEKKSDNCKDESVTKSTTTPTACPTMFLTEYKSDDCNQI